MKTNRYQQGAIALEFSVTLPVLLLLIFLSYDLTRMSLLQGKLARLNHEAGSLISQRAQFRIDDVGNPIAFSEQELNSVVAWLNTRSNSPVKMKVTQLTDISTQWLSGQSSCSFSTASLYNQHKLKDQRLFVIDVCYIDSEFSLVNGWFNHNEQANYASRVLMVER